MIEGAGGLMVPLGEEFSVVDLISELGSYVLVVARNQLGVINHTRLTLNGLAGYRCKGAKIVLMGSNRSDVSAMTNACVLRELANPTLVLEVPFLGVGLKRVESMKRKCKKIKKTLAAILGFDTFRVLFKSSDFKTGRKNC